MLQKAFKSCPKSNKSPDLVTLFTVKVLCSVSMSLRKGLSYEKSLEDRERGKQRNWFIDIIEIYFCQKLVSKVLEKLTEFYLISRRSQADQTSL